MLIGWEIPIGAVIGAFAWLMNKRWEISERRRLRYIEIVSRLSELFEAGTPAGRHQLLNEVSKLWIDADRNVVLAAEKALDAIQAELPSADDELRKLVAIMRRDARFLWNRNDLKYDEIKFRSPGKHTE